MSEKQTDFEKLSEAVISELKGLEYMDSSLTNYRRLYARIGSFMYDHSIKEYSPQVGKDFVAEYYPFDTQRCRMVLMMLRRLDDHLNDLPYRCHHSTKTPDASSAFVRWLDDYLDYCIGIGNKPETVKIKKGLCLIFLHFLSNIDCNDISEITAEIVAKSCLIYTNKDVYSVLRQFLTTCLHKLKSTQQGLQIGNNTNIFLEKSPNFIAL